MADSSGVGRLLATDHSMAGHGYHRRVRRDHSGRPDVGIEPIVAGVSSAHRRLADALRAWSGAVCEPDPSESASVVAVLTRLLVAGEATNDPAELVEAFDRSNRVLEAGWSDVDGSADRRAPYLRWRAVEIAHLELGRTVATITYGLEDLPPDFVRREVRELEMLWCARRSLGLASLPATVRVLPPTERLGWLMGLVTVPGAAAAGLSITSW